MNKKIIKILVFSWILIGLLYFWVLPSNYERRCKSRIYSDLNDIVNESKRAVIGIILEENNNGNISHNGIGSGVIFDKNDNTYYALTAAHVIDGNGKIKLFTINTEYNGKSIDIDDTSFIIPDEEYYESLINGNIEYISDSDDLAIISFKVDEELPILEFETNKIEVGNRVVAIGHTEGNRYNATYGRITSLLKTVTLMRKADGKKSTDRVYEHSAYLNFGNSGGVLISENKKIIGLNIGGSFTILGYFTNGYMIPYDILEENINNWKNHLLNK